MKAGWKNRIEERRYFEEKREKHRKATQQRMEWRLQDEKIQRQCRVHEQAASSIAAKRDWILFNKEVSSLW